MKKYNSMAFRLIVLFVSIFVIIAMTFVWFMDNSSRNFQQQSTQSLHQELASHMIAESQLLRDGKIDATALEHTFHSMMLLGPAFEIYVTDIQGKVLAFSAAPGKVKRKVIDITPIKHFLSGQSSFPLLGQDPRNLNGQKIFSAAKIFQEEHLQGYLYVIIGSELEDKIIANLTSNKLLSNTIAIALTAAFLALVIALLLIWLITRPLSRLTKSVAQYEAQQGWQNGQSLTLLASHHLVPSNEEKQLSNVIEQMSQTIAKQFDALKYKDNQRRELLSYISHDLRTPLASLTGYIETWQSQYADNAEPQSRGYIDVALKNAHVLSGLVQQVFELAHLETGGVELNREPIAIAELAQDIIESFSLQAKEAGVSLDFSPKDASIQVDADIAKLERVFANLVANAIRHTPDGGEILISFETISVDNEDKVLIRVTDSGVGIAKEQLPRVFEAHFRASNKTYSETGNAGLGLAIVKALLALHQSDINVASVEDEGTTFMFYLPRYRIQTLNN